MCFPKSSYFWDLLRLLFLPIAILVMVNLTAYVPFTRLAYAQVPLEAQSENIEKSLRQSLPQEFPSDSKAPKITRKTGPTGKVFAAGPTFFLKKIKLKGNSVISDERLVSQVSMSR